MTIIFPNKLYKDIDFSFTAHPETGAVLKKIDVNSLKQSIRSLLFTTRGERLFQPDIGSDIYRLLFEPIDPITTETLRYSIQVTLENFEPRIIVDLIEVVPLYDKNSYEISIFFTIRGIAQPASFTTYLERLR